MPAKTILPLTLVVPLFCSLAAAAAPAAGLALDWTSSYWRHHVTLRPPEFVPPVEDSRGRGRKYSEYWRSVHGTAAIGQPWSPDAPADWTRTAFDDASWPRERRPMAGSSGPYDWGVRVKRLRGHFHVADPARVKSLELEIEYIGGAVAYLNGKELGRGHLPEGELTGDVQAESYPVAAYEWGIPTEFGYGTPPWTWKSPSEAGERWRRLKLAVDPKLLGPGDNVLAVAVHHAGYRPWRYENMMGSAAKRPWVHLNLRTLRLSADPAEAVPAAARPAGVQVWAEDIHRRVVDRDIGPAEAGPAVVRLVGARRGAYSAQIVVGSSSPVDEFSAAGGALARDGGGGTIPASHVSVRYPAAVPLDKLKVTKFFHQFSYVFSPPADRMIERYMPSGPFQFAKIEEFTKPRQNVLDAAKALHTFERLSEGAPGSVPADRCQPVWITVRVPHDAPPGLYRGKLTVQAGGPREVEVRLYVVDWALTEPREFASFVGLRQWPWAPADRFGFERWSEPHWRSLERTMALLGEVGNDLAVLPLVTGGEEDGDESLVPWIKKGDGYEYDWTNLDRYLDLVAKHWGKQAAVVGEVGWTDNAREWVFTHRGVTVIEEGTKREMPLPKPGTDEWKAVMAPFATAVAERVKAKGFERFYWGFFYDRIPSEPVVKILQEAVPGVGWARASHDGFLGRPFPEGDPLPNLDVHIRAFPGSADRDGNPHSGRGWKNRDSVHFTRGASHIQFLDQYDSPMAFRWLTENSLIAGASGFSRVGADFWNPRGLKSWYHLFVEHLLHPGEQGAEGSIAFEALREGVQEAEVRIRLERADKDRDERIARVLNDRIRFLWGLPCGSGNEPMIEYHGGWQERSWELYAAAAEAFGGKSPTDQDRARFFAPAD